MTQLDPPALPAPRLDHTFWLVVVDAAVLVATDGRSDESGLAATVDRLLRIGVTVVATGPHARRLRELLAPGPHVDRLIVRADEPSAAARWVVDTLAARLPVHPEDILLLGVPHRGAPDGPVSVTLDTGGCRGAAARERCLAHCHALLQDQARRHPVALPGAPSSDPTWTLIEEGYEVTREHEVESLHAIANGHLGVRGSLAEGTALSHPGTFAAGLYLHPPDDVPELAPLPEWTALHASLDGQPIRLEHGTVVAHRRVLDLRQGVAWRHWRHRLPDGREVEIDGLRLVSRADRHLMLQSVSIRSPTGGLLQVDRAVPETGEAHGAGVVGRSELTRPEATDRLTTSRLTLDLPPDRAHRLDRAVVVMTPRDTSQPLKRATAHIDDVLARHGVERLLEAHVQAWDALWRDADIRIPEDPDLQIAIRLAIYHLLSSVDPRDETVSIGARGLTGAVYKGHVFWDTEIYMLPMLALTWPEAARATLSYRYHTLPAARAKAASMGYRGALYAWESADTGEEVTPAAVVAPDGEVVSVHAGTQEQHISADVAWAVWHYWQVTGDEGFLLTKGAEILFETARFWASRFEPGADGLLHIRGVIGPDEYHVGVDDNAFTNVMAIWNLERAVEVAWTIAKRWPDEAERLARQLDLSDAEIADWARLTTRVYTGFDPRTGLFEQFRGYFDLEHIDPADHEPRSVPLDVLLGRERVQNSQIIKQADVVMLMYLLEEWLPRPVREVNFAYYEPRTGHGSSLSPSIHATVAARLGDLTCAERYLRQTVEIDLGPEGNAAGGMHMAALGGMWQAIVYGFGGLELTSGGPRLRPRLPPSWGGLELQLRFRGQRYPLIAGGGS